MHELDYFGESIVNKWVIDIEVRYPWYKCYKWEFKRYGETIICHKSNYLHYICDNVEEVNDLLDMVSKHKHWKVASWRFVENGEVF